MLITTIISGVIAIALFIKMFDMSEKVINLEEELFQEQQENKKLNTLISDITKVKK